MKHFLKLLGLGLIVLSLTNCGSKKGGGGGAVPPGGNNAVDANLIKYNDGSTDITWSEAGNNIYIPASNDCVKGLARDRDDQVATIKVAQLQALIDSSTVSGGTAAAPSGDSPQITLQYDNGSTETFALDPAAATPSEPVLSNGPLIIEYFDEVDTEIRTTGYIDCPGKTQK